VSKLNLRTNPSPMDLDDLDELEKDLDVAEVLPGLLRVAQVVAVAFRDGRLTLTEIVSIGRALVTVVAPHVRIRASRSAESG
jgi:hypothetical protein